MNAWGISDRGVIRQQNQDSFHMEIQHDTEQAICVVCDGMGGARAGNVASEMAVESFVGELRMLLKPGINAKSMRGAIRKSVQVANERVYSAAKPNPDYDGMGTTLVGGMVTPDMAVIGNVGDSRAYLIDSEDIVRITRDHSIVEDLLSRGELSVEEAKNHPSKNLITRALGTESEVYCDIYTVVLKRGDYLLFCSDGLSNIVEEQEILYEVLHGGDPGMCCRRLLNMAMDRGGPDNITMILLSV